MPRVATALASVALIAVPFVASPATSIELEWSASGTDCPSRAEVEADIVALLASSSAPRVLIDIRIAESASGARAEVVTTIGGSRGERVLVAPTCREAAHAAALVVALAVDPFAIESAPSSTEASASASASSSATASTSASLPTSAPSLSAITPSPPMPAPTCAPPPAARRLSRLFLAAGGALDGAALPRVTLGVAAQLGIEIGRLRLGGVFLALPSNRTTLESRPAGGTFSLYAGSLHACPKLFSFLAPCAALEIGRMSGEGFGVRSPGSGSATWSAALAGAALTLRRGSWGLRAEGFVVVPLSRPDFYLGAVGVVHTPSVGARALLSLELSLF